METISNILSLCSIFNGVLSNIIFWPIGIILYLLIENFSRWRGEWYDCIYDKDGNLIKRDVLHMKGFPGSSNVRGKIKGLEPEPERTHRRWTLKGKIVDEYNFIAYFWSDQKGVKSYGAWFVHLRGSHDYLFTGKYLKLYDKNETDTEDVRLMVVRKDKWKEEYRRWPEFFNDTTKI